MESLTDFEGIVLAALRFNLAATAEGIAEALDRRRTIFARFECGEHFRRPAQRNQADAERDRKSEVEFRHVSLWKARIARCG